MTADPRSAISPTTVGLVALGGAAGAGVRWGVVALAVQPGDPAGSFPWWTLLVNVVGCLALGALLGVREDRRALLGVGFCGGLTTFSTLTVEVAHLLEGGDVAVGAGYLVATLVLGVGAVLAGWRVAPAMRP